MTSILDCLDQYSSDSDSEIDEIDNYFDNDADEHVDEHTDEHTCEHGDEYADTENEIVVGIDLGTSNSCISVWRNNNLEIIPVNGLGDRTLPSVVSFTNRSRYVGKEAKKQVDLNPENSIYEIKRLIGRKYEDEVIKQDQEFLTYGVDKDDKDNIVVKTNVSKWKTTYTPEEISSIILMELKMIAEDYLGQSVNKAVITVPAYFNDAQRQATKDAAEIAGLECCRIINEPTAAALAYGLEKKSITKEEDLNVLVYDFGGGTLDTSLLNISDGMFQVLASTGNTHLGGADFDNRLVSYCKNYFKKKYKINKLINLPLTSLQKLRNSCENAKKVLSITWKANIAVRDFYDGKNLFITLTRDKFNIICRDLLILCLKPVEDVLASCDMEKDEIDEIILVGGATRIPAIRDNLKLFFQGKEPNSTINPDEVVSAGAAIQGYIIANKTDPFSENVVLLDVIPLSLGVETIGGVMNVLIQRNSVIPIKRKRKYTTDSDYETSVKVKIYEGERKMTKDNFLVGEFLLEGLESAPRGIAEIEITFCIDVNGIISVTAEDLKNDQNKNSITITGNKGRLTPEEIKKLVKEAREQEMKDKLEREKMQLFYEIEDLCSNIEVNIKSDDFKLKPKDVELITADIDKVTDWLKEKQYSGRNKKELEKVLVRIKKKYGTLMLRATHENDNVKGDGGEKVEATTVYGDEEDEENVYEEVENEEFGFTDDMAEEEKNELRQLRETMVELCYNIFEIISGMNTKISKEDATELRDHIDDILLWVHVKEKIKKIDYIQKIDEINKSCDDMIQKYEGVDMFEKNAVANEIGNKKDELEQMCYAIMSSIHNNMFSLHDHEIKSLDEQINGILEWVLQGEIDSKKAELDGKEFLIPDDEYQKKIDEINDMCNDLYNDMLSINVKNFTEDIISTPEDSSEATVVTGGGTSIQSLLAQAQSEAQSEAEST